MSEREITDEEQSQLAAALTKAHAQSLDLIIFMARNGINAQEGTKACAMVIASQIVANGKRSDEDKEKLFAAYNNIIRASTEVLSALVKRGDAEVGFLPMGKEVKKSL